MTCRLCILKGRPGHPSLDPKKMIGALLFARAAERAIRVIQSGAGSLSEQPEMGRPMRDDPKRRELYLPFGASAYVLRYQIETDTVVIVRVRHGREV
ncbi:MAG: type II toxin-antitoxin system RelE/ParE family toxin [Sedimenticola sp.]